MRTFDIEVDLWSKKVSSIWLSRDAQDLYDKWMESNDDQDFEELADYVRSEVAEYLDFTIEDIVEAI